MRLEAATRDGTKRFVIEREEPLGWYLYVFEDNRCVMDYLQDTLEQAQEQAHEQFGMARESWHASEG
jgi:hypothetical protein